MKREAAWTTLRRTGRGFRIRRILLLGAAMGLGLPGAGSAQERPLAFVGARILPIDGAPIERGTLVVRGGRIEAVGPDGAVSVPADAEVRDVSGMWLMPGLVDTHSHLGRGDGGDRSSPIQPDARILDALDVRDPGFRKARAGGITTVNVMPGSGHLISGQTAYLKLRSGGEELRDFLFCADPVREICGGLKMANGTNPIGAAPFPGTRARSAALLREEFTKARDYQRRIREAGEDPSKLPPRDLRMEALVEVLEGRRIAHAHTHRQDDILTMLRLRDEFGYTVVLHHVTEGGFVAGEIAAAGVAASIIAPDAPGGKEEALRAGYAQGVAMERAGVLVGFHSDDGITDSRLFRRLAGMYVRAGMTREGALEGLTIAGARMLGLEDRIGSLTPGKDADFILLDGDPLSVYTHVTETWVEGARVFDRSDPADREFAVGGPGAGRGDAWWGDLEHGVLTLESWRRR